MRRVEIQFMHRSRLFLPPLRRGDRLPPLNFPTRALISPLNADAAAPCPMGGYRWILDRLTAPGTNGIPDRGRLTTGSRQR
jgi:hypothetical protein